MVKKLLSQMIAAAVGLWAASQFVPGVSVRLLPDSNFFGVRLTALWQVFLLLGIILGILNFFVKPVLNIIALPLRLITLGIFGFFINMALVWAVDVMFKELYAPWLWPLLWTTVIIWASNLFFTGFVLHNSKDND